jgi:hypothetical protein
MYTTVTSTQATLGNGSYGTNGSEALDALAAIAFSDAGSTIADVSGLVSSFHANGNTFDMVQSMGLKDEPMGVPTHARASCPVVSAVTASAQPRSSCPLIKITPAEQLAMPAVTMADLTLLNGNSLAPPTMFASPTFAMESLINTIPSSASDWSDVTSDASLSSFDERGSPLSDFDLSDELSALSVRPSMARIA